MNATDLNTLMDFDHVIQVHADGTVTDAPAGVYAPDLRDDELDSADWSLMSGYTAQYGYDGPVMHASEYIGGGMAAAILDHPGLYVAIVATVTPSDKDAEEFDVAGWAVAYIPAP